MQLMENQHPSLASPTLWCVDELYSGYLTQLPFISYYCRTRHGTRGCGVTHTNDTTRENLVPVNRLDSGVVR